jgi:hypothetical protein
MLPGPDVSAAGPRGRLSHGSGGTITRSGELPLLFRSSCYPFATCMPLAERRPCWAGSGGRCTGCDPRRSPVERPAGARWRIAPEVAEDGGRAGPLHVGGRRAVQAGPHVADLSHVWLTSTIRSDVPRPRRFRKLLGSDPFSKSAFWGQQGPYREWLGSCLGTRSHSERPHRRRRALGRNLRSGEQPYTPPLLAPALCAPE